MQLQLFVRKSKDVDNIMKMDAEPAKSDRYKKRNLPAGKLTAIWRNKDKDSENEDRQVLYEAEDVERIFRRISDEDIDALGFNKDWCRPEWLICSCLLIPPLHCKTFCKGR